MKYRKGPEILPSDKTLIQEEISGLHRGEKSYEIRNIMRRMFRIAPKDKSRWHSHDGRK